MKRARFTEEQIIGILQVEEDQKMVWETIFPTKVKRVRSAPICAANMACLRAGFTPGRASSAA